MRLPFTIVRRRGMYRDYPCLITRGYIRYIKWLYHDEQRRSARLVYELGKLQIENARLLRRLLGVEE